MVPPEALLAAIMEKKMKKFIALAALFLLPFSVEAGELRPYEIPRTHTKPIQDSKFDRQYDLYIKLPEDYEENNGRLYPVIYTTDAVWHFDMLSGVTEYLTPDVILVGISWQKNLDDEREFVSRFRDYSVLKSETAQVPTGEASHHLSFIRDDVITFVENNYRADPANRTYFGYSLGGLFGVYVLLAAPDTFQQYIIGSPALGERSAAYIDELEAKTASRQKNMNANVFFSIGELEESEMDLTRELMAVLQRRAETGLALTDLQIIEDANHTTAFPVTAVRSVKWLSQLNNE